MPNALRFGLALAVALLGASPAGAQEAEVRSPRPPRAAAVPRPPIPAGQQVSDSPTTVVVDAAAAQRLGGLPQFLVDPFWPKPLPDNWILGQVSGVAVDRNDRIWVIQRPASLSDREVGAEQSPPWSKCCYAAPPVLVFDQSGHLLKAWGGPDPGYEWPEEEHGIYVDEAGFVWIGGSGSKDSQILKFTEDGKFVLQIGHSGQLGGSNDTANLGRPADINVDAAAHEVYVADGYRNRRVIVFDSETGAYKRHWGAYGRPPSDEKLPPYDPAAASTQFGSPVHCVRFTVEGLVYVCDRRILERATNQVVGRLGRPGRYAGQFHVVHNIAIDSAGNLYTTEVNTGQRVQRFVS